MKFSRLLSSFALAGSFTVAPVASAGTLYGLTFFDNQLITIDSNTGVGSLVGSLGESVNGYGLAFRGNELLTFDPNQDVFRAINPSTGSLGASHAIGVGNLVGEGDLAFRSDGIGFLSSALTPDFSPANDLFRIDIAAGTSERIGTTDLVIDGMVFSNDVLYAIGQSGAPSLYTVDQDTAAFTLVGSLGIEMGSPFSALAVDSMNNLFAAVDDRLYQIDSMTGMATVVDPTVMDVGFNSISGLAFAPERGGEAVPDSSASALLVAVGLAGLACFRRKRIPGAAA